MQEHHGNDKSCVWHAADFADGELKDELFCIRFASVESMYFLISVASLYVFSHISCFFICQYFFAFLPILS